MVDLSYYDSIINTYPGKISEYEKKIDNYSSVKPVLAGYISSLDNIIDTLQQTNNIVESGVIINSKPIDDGEISSFIASIQSIRENINKLCNECNEGISHYENEKIIAKNEYNNAITQKNKLISNDNTLDS